MPHDDTSVVYGERDHSAACWWRRQWREDSITVDAALVTCHVAHDHLLQVVQSLGAAEWTDFRNDDLRPGVRRWCLSSVRRCAEHQADSERARNAETLNA